MKKITSAAALARAIHALYTTGKAKWMQGRYGNEKCCCLVGAARVVLQNDELNATSKPFNTLQKRILAAAAASKEGDFGSLEGYNDADGRTRKQVLAMLRSQFA